jgi:hypothetical protein
MKTEYYKKKQKNLNFGEEKREAGKNLHVQPA